MGTMKAAGLIGLVLISEAWLQAAPTCSTATATTAPASIRVPTATGYSFPTDSALLLRLNAAQNSKEIRKHAWAVFAGIIQDSIPGDPCSPPIWDTWFNVVHTARDQENSTPKLIRLDVPLETVAAFFRDGTGLAQARGNTSAIPLKSEMMPLQAVVQALHNVGEQKLYNSAAHDWIVNNDLLMTERLANQLKAVGNSAIDQRTIPPFPPESIIIKAKWQSITNEGSNYVWYWEHGSPNHCPGGCFEKVAVRKARSDEPCNLPLKKPADIRSTCFYTVIDDGQPGNSLILLGLHVMTKEISDWTWSTFWWSPDAKQKSKFSDGRFGSKIIPGPWRNYLMDTTLSMSKPGEKRHTLGDKPLEADACHQNWSEPSRSKIDFNPYIEVAPDDGGGMLNARLSNCMNCHKRSSYPGFSNNNMRGIPWRGELRSDTDCFADQLRLDYLWSLSPLDPVSKLGQFYFHVQQQLNASAARLELR